MDNDEQRQTAIGASTAAPACESRISVLEGVCGGDPCVRGTRVPVKALFENIESGATIDEFLQWFPGASSEQVSAVLTCAEVN